MKVECNVLGFFDGEENEFFLVTLAKRQKSPKNSEIWIKSKENLSDICLISLLISGVCLLISSRMFLNFYRKVIHCAIISFLLLKQLG